MLNIGAPAFRYLRLFITTTVFRDSRGVFRWECAHDRGRHRVGGRRSRGVVLRCSASLGLTATETRFSPRTPVSGTITAAPSAAGMVSSIASRTMCDRNVARPDRP